ncbi:MAG: tetratricopeptide repeat protein [Lachnospiraceae bacterium]|nr:tetratricopeptide repeat protein [Lachnospiraceae bacterium]
MEMSRNKKIILAVIVILIAFLTFFGIQVAGQKLAVKEGLNYLQEKEYEKAHSSFEKAEKKHTLFLSKSDIRYYEGECLMYLERFDEAADVYGHIFDTRAIALKGFALQRNGDLKGAKKAFEEAIKKDAKDGVGYYYLYAYYVDKKAYNKALNVLDEAKGNGVKNMKQEIDFARIVVYEKMLKYDRALDAAKEYVDAYPDDENGKQELAFLETR